MAYLNNDGLLYLWTKLKALFNNKVDKVDGKQLSTNDYTTSEKNKLAGLSNYTHPTTTGNKHIPAGGSSGQILRWSADGTAAWGADNDTKYSVMNGATASSSGSSGLVPAPASGKQNQYLRGDGTWSTPTDTIYDVATQSSSGLMSAADKIKLDGVETGANNYNHPTYTEYQSGLYKMAVNSLGHITAATAVSKSDITALGIPSKDTTYSVATQSKNGLMSSSDKAKLDAFESASTYATTSYVAQQIAGAGHIKKTIVTSLPSASEAADNTIYMIKKTTADGDNAYDEYMLVGSTLEKIGDTKTVIISITNGEIDTILES